METHSSIFAWRIPWAEEGYSPWGRIELDMTEHLTLYPLWAGVQKNG